MDYNGYEITHFHPDLLHGVVKLLEHLWGDDNDRNLSYFHWKYNQNPYTENALGIVALHKNEVVGFRGYFATRWEITTTQKKIFVLCPGDTCVHPDHRRMRLSLAMGNMAMSEYAQNYPVFLNFTSSKSSVPGYLRMGFIPITNKIFMSRSNLPSVAKYILADKKTKDLKEGKISFGEFGAIEVSDRPRPKEMFDVISKQKETGKRICLFQDEEFFQWRYNNKRRKYVFYYCKKNNIIESYVAVRVSANNQRGFIVDYASKDNPALKQIFEFIIKMKHFTILSIYTYSVTDPLAGILKKLKFKINSIFRIIERKVEGEWPLLVRPVEKNYDETHCIIHGLDIRQIQNWSIREICSDAS